MAGNLHPPEAIERQWNTWAASAPSNRRKSTEQQIANLQNSEARF
jgi:hypothetical protein